MKRVIPILLMGILTTIASPNLELYLDAISELESNDRDNVIGTAGEVSRYQILPAVWRAATQLPIERAACRKGTARAVARKILISRLREFERRYERSPGAREIWLLWNAPALVYDKLPIDTRRLGIAERFDVIVQKRIYNRRHKWHLQRLNARAQTPTPR